MLPVALEQHRAVMTSRETAGLVSGPEWSLGLDCLSGRVACYTCRLSGTQMPDRTTSDSLAAEIRGWGLEGAISTVPRTVVSNSEVRVSVCLARPIVGS